MITEPKPRMVIVGSPELEHLLAHQGDIGVPFLYKTLDYRFYVGDADELRRWREGRYTPTSQPEQP